MSTIEKEVSLLRIKQPLFLTLASLPANEVAFKVVRSDSSTIGTRRKRTKRSCVLYVAIPAGHTQEDAEELARQFGVEGYDILEGDDGTFVLKRTDVTEIPDTGVLKVGVANGVVVGVEAPKVQRDDVGSGIAVSSFEFDCNIHTEDSAKEYLSSCGIDISSIVFDTVDSSLVYKRGDVGENTETRRITVDNGVVVEIMRAETVQLPANLVAVVSEVAYGQWGWGQLDFAAALADTQFSSAADDATYKLRSVLDRILFHSELPISIRKELVTRACSQFASYVNGLMDALPEQVLMAVSSFVQRKESEMADKQVENVSSGEADAKGNDSVLTRNDVITIVNDAITAALTLRDSAGEQKTATEGDDTVSSSVDVVRNDDVKEGKFDAILGAVQKLSEAFSTVTENVAGVVKRIDDLESSTIVRSDTPDSRQKEGKGNASDDPFRGAIFGRRGE